MKKNRTRLKTHLSTPTQPSPLEGEGKGGGLDQKITVEIVKVMKKEGRRIVSLTAYDYWTGRLLDESGVHVILVGDSLGMVMLGYSNTLPVTMKDMLHHTRAVSRGVSRALVVGDMPFMSYQVSVTQAVEQAGRFIKVGRAEAVKLEGGADVAPHIRAMVKAGIPVMGHLGLTPQSILTLGGYRVQGREPAVAKKMMADAKALQNAGAFSLVLECVPAWLGRKITTSLNIPTIGIGAGKYCDGQILVTHDLLGLTTWFKQPKFTKRYAHLPMLIKQAVGNYAREVQEGAFPGKEHSYE